MKRLAIVAVTGVLALALNACDQGANKPVTEKVKVQTTTEKSAPAQAPAAPAEPVTPAQGQ